MTTIEVRLGDRSYPIYIGSGLLAQETLWRNAIRGRHVLVVSNTTVAPLYLQRVVDGLGGFNMATLLIDDGEQFKSLDQASRVFDALATLGANRDATIVALGGGVIGDLAGFAAACWMRGVGFVQMPTTLLAMVDSSVGGKTGVNLAAGKNLVGAFHQPQAVVIDTATLATLPDREYAAGLAEVIKYGAIGDDAFFDWLEANAAALTRRADAVVAEAIAISCRHKAGVVARDEREEGERALLNFGHTFGHALEAEAGYGTLLHGEAVAIGMVLAARLSNELGMADASDSERLQSLLRDCGLPTTVPPVHPVERLIERMRLDKKNLGGTLRLILWRGVGRAEVVAGVAEDAITRVLRS